MAMAATDDLDLTQRPQKATDNNIDNIDLTQRPTTSQGPRLLQKDGQLELDLRVTADTYLVGRAPTSHLLAVHRRRSAQRPGRRQGRQGFNSNWGGHPGVRSSHNLGK
jgi:hypothetical protein